MNTPTEQLLDLLRRGPQPARQLVNHLAVSRPTLGRLVQGARGRVVRIGRARATQYALRREIRTHGDRWPVYRVGPDGRAETAATLHALAPRAWWYEPNGQIPDWLSGDFRSGLFPDLPWFLDGLRPQGFLGRAFARRHAETLGLSPDPSVWDAGGVLTALLLHGDDLPGDFVIGNPMLDKAQRLGLATPPTLSLHERATGFSHLSAAALAGELIGSSAGGEQPKFTTCIDDGQTLRHVLVKFSPPDDTAAGRRWADLLACEHLAAETMREHVIPTCSTEVVDADGRRYLQVVRFDRVGVHGRRGFVALAALDAAYYGRLDTWHAAAERLQHDGWLSPDDADRLRVLWYFGGLIGNSDMHFGNISLAFDHARPLPLAPCYDMLPMHYRPGPTGELSTREFTAPLPAPQHRQLWARAAQMAETFWQRAATETRISDAFRDEARRVLQRTQTLAQRFA